RAPAGDGGPARSRRRSCGDPSTLALGRLEQGVGGWWPAGGALWGNRLVERSPLSALGSGPPAAVHSADSRKGARLSKFVDRDPHQQHVASGDRSRTDRARQGQTTSTIAGRPRRQTASGESVSSGRPGGSAPVGCPVD